LSTRERWVVYPLLFLSLGVATQVALRTKLAGEVLEADTVRCLQLEVVDQEGRIQARLHSLDGGGVITLFDPDRQQAVLVGQDGKRYGVFLVRAGTDSGAETSIPLTLYGPRKRPPAAIPSKKAEKSDPQPGINEAASVAK
jgi:hypothetical protein